MDPKPAETGVQLWRQRQLWVEEEEEGSQRNAEATLSCLVNAQHIRDFGSVVFSLVRNVLKTTVTVYCRHGGVKQQLR